MQYHLWFNFLRSLFHSISCNIFHFFFHVQDFLLKWHLEFFYLIFFPRLQHFFTSASICSFLFFISFPLLFLSNPFVAVFGLCYLFSFFASLTVPFTNFFLLYPSLPISESFLLQKSITFIPFLFSYIFQFIIVIFIHSTVQFLFIIVLSFSFLASFNTLQIIVEFECFLFCCSLH